MATSSLDSTIPVAASTDDRPRLTGRLGVFSITLMVVATAAPLAVIGGTSPLATAYGNGVGAAGDFVVVSALLLLFAVALSAMSRYIRNAGAFYAYVGHGLGTVVGMVAAALSWVTYTSLQLASYAYFGVVANSLVTTFGGPAIPWWSFSFVALFVVAFLGYRHIDLTARVLGIALGLEVLVVVIVDVAIGARGGAAGFNLEAFTPVHVFGNFSGFAIGAMLCGAGFIGFEATAVFRDEARDPDRTVPKATYLAIVFIGVFYAVSTWLVSLSWNSSELIKQAALGLPYLLGAAEAYVGPIIADVISVLIVSSMFACVLSLHNILARYQYVLGRSRVLPRSLGSAHPKHGSPHRSSLVQSATAFVLLLVAFAVGLDPVAQILAWFAGLASATFFLLLALTCLAVFVFFVRTGLDRRLWQTRIAPAAGFLGLAALFTITVLNFSFLVGGTGLLGWLLLSILPIAAVAAVVLTLTLRRTRPERYAAIVELTRSTPAA